MKTKQKKLGKQGMNDCVYSPVKPNVLQLDSINGLITTATPHDYCLHNHYCIFNENRIGLETQINELETKLKDFRNIKEAAINGEVIYHKELDSYYQIDIAEYTGADGKKHYKTSVGLSDKFMGALNRKIANLEYDLRSQVNFQIDVIHGKIGGYGYGD